MEEELSRSWRTLFQILKESSKDSYTPEEILSLMRRVLHDEMNNFFMKQVEGMEW